ncbi:MAG: thiolase family protein [Candidatus Thermoplasmatota archaeon]|jgi:acetyl-CoA acetyltransferase family protein|nr:thiolase family protein [Candidatus Thermoplasmatota archaeon]
MNRELHDAYVIENLRTPFGRRNGYFRNTHPVNLLGSLSRELLARLKIEPSNIDDFIVGSVDQFGEQSANIARNAWLSAGLPETVPGVTVDRQCGSSLQSIQFGYSGIESGIYDLVLAGGVESMTRVPMFSSIHNDSTPMTKELRQRYPIDEDWFSQARAASIVAEKYGITREEMDIFSLESHRKAHSNINDIRSEIFPVMGADRDGNNRVVDSDEGVRTDSTIEKLSGLKNAFYGVDNITAGNSSQISDGASLTLIASEQKADQLDLNKRARLRSFTVAGVNPVEMLTGPIDVTKRMLKKENLTMEDFDYFEVNEAFASVVLAWIKSTGADPDKVNINGGAIAIGHPLGATGSRLVGTMLNVLERKKANRGLIAICEGGGMANGVIVERIE